MTPDKSSLIRTTYLYLVSLIALMMVIISSAYLINLGLKTWVLTKADETEYYWESPPKPHFPTEVEPEEILVCSEKCELTSEQKEQIELWLTDYKNWQKKIKDKSPQRQRDVATTLPFLMVGLPLFIYHWRLARNENNNRKKENKL